MVVTMSRKRELDKALQDKADEIGIDAENLDGDTIQEVIDDIDNEYGYAEDLENRCKKEEIQNEY